MSEKGTVIIGAGHGAGQLCASLRQEGYEGAITLIGEEPHLPYQRPPLSKAYLSGDLAAERLFVKPPAFYDKQNISVQLSTRAERIDPQAQSVHLSNGEQIAYAHLVLATGTRVRPLNISGSDLNGIHYLRGIDDVDAMRANFDAGKRLVIVGAGYIGLEVAAVARKMGMEVTVLEAAPRVLGRVTGTTVSNFFQDTHRSHGVDIRCGVSIDRFDGVQSIESVIFSDGTSLACDVVLIGIGVLPNQELAADAGLSTDNGIIVDEYTRTSDPNVYAIGDCTRHPSAYLGGSLRLESVQNALEQAKAAAAAITGKDKPYHDVPWFWSDQYDCKLQSVGISTDRFDREVIRGDVADGKFSVFYLAGDELVAMDSISAPADFMAARKLIGAGISPTAEQLADTSVPLKTYLTA